MSKYLKSAPKSFQKPTHFSIILSFFFVAFLFPTNFLIAFTFTFAPYFLFSFIPHFPQILHLTFVVFLSCLTLERQYIDYIVPVNPNLLPDFLLSNCENCPRGHIHRLPHNGSLKVDVALLKKLHLGQLIPNRKQFRCGSLGYLRKVIEFSIRKLAFNEVETERLG
jgi:hypothetical protein